MAYFNFNLFRDGKMVQIGDHIWEGTKAQAIARATQLVESEAVDKVSVEDKGGLIVAVVRRKGTK